MYSYQESQYKDHILCDQIFGSLLSSLLTYTCGMGTGKCTCLIASRACGQLVMCGVWHGASIHGSSRQDSYHASEQPLQT